MHSPDKTSDFDFPNMQTQWKGYISSVDKTTLSENVYVKGSKNIYKKLNGNLSVREGQLRLGAADSTQSPVSSSYVWNTSWGATYTMVISNSNLYVVINDVWYSLLSSLTATRYVFDKWWDNTEKKDRLLFVHGNSDIQHWSGGYATILSSTINTITKTGTTSWQQAGFSTTSGEKTIVINGTTYTYTGGESTTTLTGVTPDPTGEAIGSTVLQAVQTTSNKPASGFNNDFIKIINNQVYVGSYTSRLCYISKNTDFKDYTVPTPRAPGDPELLTLDDTLKGIGVRQGNAHIGIGSDRWAVVSFENITVGTDLTQKTNVNVKPVALQQAPLAHEFIANVGDNLVYLAQDQQLRAFGDFNNLFVSGYPSYSQEIATELTAEDFDGGAISCIGEFTYICAPNTGNVWLFQVRQTVDNSGNVVSERLWHSPFVWSITNILNRDGVIIGFSNANPQIYQMWGTNQWYDDSPSDESLPYQCTLALSYRTLNRRQGMQSFNKLFTEGYMTLGTPLNCLINYDYQGSTNSIIVPINSITRPARFFQTIPHVLGDESLGDDILGNEFSSIDDDTDLFPKFKNINSVAVTNCFEYQPIYESNDVGARWEILAVGTNAGLEDLQQATFLINKIRN